MGKQIHIEVADLLKAGCRVEFSATEWEDQDNETGKTSKGHYVRAQVTTPDRGDSFCMDGQLDDLSSLWCDYNDWGSNKAVIEPKIKRLNIPHIVS